MHVRALALTIAASAPIVLAQSDPLAAVSAAFSSAKIVPDVVPTFAPQGVLGVHFVTSSGATEDVTPGAVLTKADTARPPTYTFQTNDTTLAQSTFVVAMIDPDSPYPLNATSAQVRYFLGGGFKLNPTTGALTNSTPAVTDYIDINPPTTSLPHRFVFLLYKDSAGFDAQKAVNTSAARSMFNLAAFAQSAGLGDPVAGTFMLGESNTTSIVPTSSTTPASGGVSSASLGWVVNAGVAIVFGTLLTL